MSHLVTEDYSECSLWMLATLAVNPRGIQRSVSYLCHPIHYFLLPHYQVAIKFPLVACGHVEA